MMFVWVSTNHSGKLTISCSEVKPKPVTEISFPLPAFGLGTACVIIPVNEMWKRALDVGSLLTKFWKKFLHS